MLNDTQVQYNQSVTPLSLSEKNDGVYACLFEYTVHLAEGRGTVSHQVRGQGA